MKERDKVFNFRVPAETRDLIEHYAKKSGQTMSTFLLYQALDAAMDFERTRNIHILGDFSDLFINRLSFLGEEKEVFTAKEVKNEMEKILDVYIKQRLQAQSKLATHYCQIAIDCYLNDYVEEFSGVEGFIINQCIVKIYDNMYQAGLIDEQTHAEKTAFYDTYMAHEGSEQLEILSQLKKASEA